MAKIIKFDSDAREKLKKGVDTLAELHRSSRASGEMSFF